MRTQLLPTLFFSAIIVDQVHAQKDCGAVVIEQVQYSAVHSNYIEVLAYVTDFNCIDYPSFILLSEQGDTLAVESTDFFCLSFGSPAPHLLLIRPDADIPNGSFNARLELFTGFGEALVCSWDQMDLALCPTEACTQAVVYLTNTGELETFTAYWSIYDVPSSELVATGYFDAGGTATNFDTTCLATGHYSLAFSPFSPIDDEYVVGITHNWQYSIGTNVAQQGDSTPLDLSFSWYEACLDVGNSVSEQEAQYVTITVQNKRIQMTALHGRPLGRITIHALDGRLVLQRTAMANAASISTDGLSPGIFIVRTISDVGRSFTQRIFIP